jgi:hypothetical protein
MMEEEPVIAIEIAETAKFAVTKKPVIAKMTKFAVAKSELVPAAESVSPKEAGPHSCRASHMRPHSRSASHSKPHSWVAPHTATGCAGDR